MEPSMRRRAWMDFKDLRFSQLWRRDEMGLFIHLMAGRKAGAQLIFEKFVSMLKSRWRRQLI